MRNGHLAWLAPLVFAIAIAACAGSNSSSSDDSDSGATSGLVFVLLGGDATVDNTSSNAFSFAPESLTADQQRLFAVGEILFDQDFAPTGAGDPTTDGLGPLFNAPSCNACHVEGGRGVPNDAANVNGEPIGVLVRLSVPGIDPLTGGPLPEPTYGVQFQDRSIDGVPAEGRVEIGYEIITETLSEGETYELRRPIFSLVDLTAGPLSDDALMSPRLAPQLIGMGLLEAIPESALLEAADPDDEDGDGISGRANVVGDSMTGNALVGRFGWKANVATTLNQVADAFHTDIGITNYFHPRETCTSAQPECLASPIGGIFDMDDDRIRAVVFYNQALSVPAARNTDDPDVIAGAQLFDDFGCASCHTPTQTTAQAAIPAFSNQTIHPYTDLLLHDMGPGLADGRPDFEASGSEWRTPPLWGLGLIEAVNGERYLLHDGRARSIEEAILWHGGEASAAADAFRNATPAERRQLVAFLDSL